MYIDKPHFLAKAAENDFLRLKGTFPLNLKLNFSGSMLNEGLSIDTFFYPC
jgi:hypothetical protein